MKNTLYIDIHISEVIYAVQNATNIKGESVDTKDTHKKAHDLKIDERSGNINLVLRKIGNSFGELKSRLSEYINESGTTASNKQLTADSNVGVTLYVPTNFNLAVKENIAECMHQFMVNVTLRDWYAILSKEDAVNYQKLGDTCIEQIKADINKRVRPQRGQLPNYSTDIKGGYFDAETNSIVMTNDLGEDLFSIELPEFVPSEISAGATSGTYNNTTGKITFKDKDNNNLFTVDLSALKNLYVDNSLQGVSVTNGNIVFSFNGSKSSINVPVSSIFDASNYYQKSETYDKDTIDTKIAQAGGGGGAGTLNTTNETTQSTNASESLSGTVNLHKVSKTGSYNDLLNKPTIPDAQVQSDWNASSGMGAILNKPTIPDAQIQSDWNQSDNTKKDYIKNKPTIPTVTGKADKVSNATNGNFAALDSNGNLIDSGHKHSDYLTSHQDISGKEDKRLVVPITYSNSTYSLGDSKTFADLKTAYDAGKAVEVTYNGFTYRLTNVTLSSGNVVGMLFETTNAENGEIYSFDIANDNSITQTITDVDASGKEDKLTIEDKSSETSTNSFALNPNKLYTFGSRSALDITALNAPSSGVGIYAFTFVSTTDNFDLDLPQGVTLANEDSMSIATGDIIEVTIMNGLATWISSGTGTTSSSSSITVNIGTSYTHLVYSTDGGETIASDDTGATHIGIKVDNNSTASTTPSEYTWISLGGGGGSADEMGIVGSTGTGVSVNSSGAATISATKNKLYSLGTGIISIAVTFPTPTSGKVEEFVLRFKTASSGLASTFFTFLDSSSQAADVLYPFDFVINENTEYEVAIMYDGAKYLVRACAYQ